MSDGVIALLFALVALANRLLDYIIAQAKSIHSAIKQ